MVLLPKLFTTLKGYSFRQFWTDLSAGTIVGIVALPLAIAFAIASGVSPERGLATAVIAGFLISFLGGSRVQIGGPTGAFVIIVAGIVAKYGMGGLLAATVLAGILLIVMGFAKLGRLIKYIPYPIIIGFTAGIALTIFSSQIPDFLGLSAGTLPSHFIDKWIVMARHIGTIRPEALGIGLLSLFILVFWPKLFPRVPASLVAIVAATVLVQVFHLNIDTIGSRFGHIPSGLPAPHLPEIPWKSLPSLVSPAVSIALLAAIESLLSAVAADGMIGGRHRSNMELIAQGAANIVAPLFGGIPATGAIARTATNVKNGGRTPVAGIVHALVLFLIVSFFGKWVTLIPLPALAAILITVAASMSETDAFAAALKGPKSDSVVMIVTFAVTVLVDLTVAIEIGMVLAAFLFLKKMADTTTVRSLRAESDEDDPADPPLRAVRLPRDVELYEITGPFFFGSVDKFHDTISMGARNPRALILFMKNVPYLDAGGIHALDEILAKCRRKKIRLLIAGLQKQPGKAVERTDFIRKVGRKWLFRDLKSAIKASESV